MYHVRLYIMCGNIIMILAQILGRPQIIRTGKLVKTIKKLVKQNPRKSTRKTVKEFGVSKFSIHSI